MNRQSRFQKPWASVSEAVLTSLCPNRRSFASLGFCKLVLVLGSRWTSWKCHPGRLFEVFFVCLWCSNLCWSGSFDQVFALGLLLVISSPQLSSKWVRITVPSTYNLVPTNLHPFLDYSCTANQLSSFYFNFKNLGLFLGTELKKWNIFKHCC